MQIFINKTAQWNFNKVGAASVPETMGQSKITVKPPKRTMNADMGSEKMTVNPYPRPDKSVFNKISIFDAKKNIKTAKWKWWDIWEYNKIVDYNQMIKAENKAVQDWFYHNIKDPYIIKEAEIRYKNWEDWFILFDKQRKLPYITPVEWGNGIWLHFTKKLKKTLDKIRNDILWKKELAEANSAYSLHRTHDHISVSSDSSITRKTKKSRESWNFNKVGATSVPKQSTKTLNASVWGDSIIIVPLSNEMQTIVDALRKSFWNQIKVWNSNNHYKDALKILWDTNRMQPKWYGKSTTNSTSYYETKKTPMIKQFINDIDAWKVAWKYKRRWDSEKNLPTIQIRIGSYERRPHVMKDNPLVPKSRLPIAPIFTKK